MRVIALLATYNEERFIHGCLEHLLEHGVDTYLIDNESTDGTVAIAERYLGRGMIDIEILPRRGVYDWRSILERKTEVAASLDAEWFIHLDADEIRLPPSSSTTLRAALAEVDRAGYNAVNFQEFTFVPTREAPSHDHPRFQETMRSYYPFLPFFPDRLNAWKRQVGPVILADEAGHRVSFAGLRMYPRSFPMRHYLFLSVEHAIEKYVQRDFDSAEVAEGWHGWRATLTPDRIALPSADELRRYVTDDLLDASEPWTRHPVVVDAAAPAGQG